MQYAELQTKLLEVREQREQRRLKIYRHLQQPLVHMSLNIPGSNKLPPGAEKLFSWGLRQVLELLPLVESCSHGHDLLGPWTLLGTDRDAKQIKLQTVALENATAAGRLVDIDVYDHFGRQLGRRELGLPARPCLICGEPAVDCMRQQLHSEKELKARTNALLKSFRT